MNNFFNHIPGFRSDTTWKKVLAIFYYGTCVAIIPQNFGSFIVGIALPFVVFAIKDRKKIKTPLVNRKNLNKVGLVFTVIWFALMVSMGTSMAKTTKETNAKLIQQQKTQAIATAKVNANNKILADKKAKEDKIIADKKAVADKIIADKKAKEDKIIADKKAIADKKQAIADKKIADAKAIQDKKDADAQAVIDAKAKAKQDAIDNASSEDKSALASAETYGSTMNMSKAGIYDQLVSEYGGQFSAESAQFAIDNVSIDWNANALASAETYQSSMNMSPNAIYDQLVSSYGGKFTSSQAKYAKDNLK